MDAPPPTVPPPIAPPSTAPVPTYPQPPWPVVPWPGYPPQRPPLQVSWLVLIGGVTVFFGYVLFVVSDLMYLGLPANPTLGQFAAVVYVGILGEAIVGLGFLVALLGIAFRR